MRTVLSIALMAAFAAPAWSAPRTVTLSVPTMDCPVCPITIKKALVKVVGVSKAEVNFDKRLAIVTFDDAKADVGALTRATEQAGYPSVVVGDPK